MADRFLDSIGLRHLWEKIKVLLLGKADKVSNPTNGNFASIDSDGNIEDSGYSPSDLASQKVLICNWNGSTCDKTTQEIYDAKAAGKVVVCIFTDAIYYLMESSDLACRFRAIFNQGSVMSFNYIKCLNGTWSTGVEKWSSKANVSSTPQTISVTDITALSNDQVTSLRIGDLVVLNNNNSYYTYSVSQKSDSLGTFSLVYSSYDKIEEVLYEKVGNVWSYTQTRQRQF